MIATREDRIEMAISLYKQGKSPRFCDRQCGLGSGTTKKEAESRGLYNPFRKRSDRQGRIEMALILYKQGKSAEFCDRQCGLKGGTTKKAAQARGLYNLFRKNSGGKWVANPGRQCAVCLYSVGLGYTVIGRIIGACPQAVVKWVKKAGAQKPKQTKYARAKMAAAYATRIIHSDSGHKLKDYCRGRIYKALKKQQMVKSERTLNLIGCSVDYLRKYLASMFEAGMSWDNYGKWHVDHIIPCASFDLSDKKQQKLCFHFSNLRPLWARDNIVKNDKMPDNPQLGLLLNA